MADQNQVVIPTDARSFIGFSQNQVMILTDIDFTVDERIKIFLKEKQGCAIVMFHGNNDESSQLSKVFAAAAAQAEVREFYAVNLSYNKRISKALTDLLSTNSPLRWMGMKQLPFIVTYQGGQPVGVYNGSRTVQALTDFAMTRACSQNYSEPIQVFNSVRPDVNFGIPGIAETQVPNTSLEFTDNNPLRPLSSTQVQSNQGAPGATATL